MSQTNQPSDSMTFDAQPVAQDTPAASGMTFDAAPVQADTAVNTPTPEQKAAVARQRSAAGLPVDTSFAPSETPMGSGTRYPSLAQVGGAAVAAGGLAAAPSLLATPAVGEALMSHLEEQAAEWVTKYPSLAKLIMHAAPGILPTMAGTIGYLIHKAK